MVLPSPPTAEGLFWDMSTPAPYLFVCFVSIPTGPRCVAVPGRQQSPVAVSDSPRQSRECAGMPGWRRGGFPWGGSAGQHKSPEQEPAQPLPAPHSRWLSTPAAAVNAKQGRTERSPSAGTSTLNFMALNFSVQNSVYNDYWWFGEFIAAPIVPPIPWLYWEDKTHMDYCSILMPCATCK